MKEVGFVEGDIIFAKIDFCKVFMGARGVCLGVTQQDNGVVKICFLMENERLVHMTGREVDMFFLKKGKMDVVNKKQEELLEILKKYRP